MVDVMHAGVDTQDFVELSGSEHTINDVPQYLLMNDSAMMMGQLDPSKSLVNVNQMNLDLEKTMNLAGQGNNQRSGLDASANGAALDPLSQTMMS